MVGCSFVDLCCVVFSDPVMSFCSGTVVVVWFCLVWFGLVWLGLRRVVSFRSPHCYWCISPLFFLILFFVLFCRVGYFLRVVSVCSPDDGCAMPAALGVPPGGVFWRFFFFFSS